MSLFHYTDANGLIGILENKSLWVNDVNFMNDTHELVHGLILFRDEFATYEQNEIISLTTWFLNVLINNPYQIGSFLITSFCTSGNILDMWRGYGSSGQKYSIEFDESILLQSMQEQYPDADIGFYDCIYGEESNTRLVKEVTSGWLSDTEALSIEAGKATLNIKKVIQLIVKPALMMKNYGFANEQERRLLVLMNNDFTQYRHRAGAFGITPYVNLEFTLESVKSLKVGPTQNPDGEKKSIFGILKKLGKQPPYGDDFVTVSDITYR
ncbi:DUF2971 domain-containing protein [Vibrio parahaemolyticus]|nr:DUF2971 domain-containing protein [Vibrio parahaemolyticus]